MAESNLDFKNLPVATGVTLSDFVVLSLFGGTSSRISVGLFRSAITDGLRPVVGEDGYWYVGDIPTDVIAEGRTPEFRKSSNCVEYKYTTEDDTAWKPFVYYKDLRLKYEDLNEEQIDSFKLRYTDLTEEQIKELQKPAEDAMNKLNESLDNQLLALDMNSIGEIILIYGKYNTEFQDGYINEKGEVTLEFNYE